MEVTYSEGEATVTYEADELFGFGKPDFQSTEETSDLYFDVVVDIVDDEVMVSFEP